VHDRNAELPVFVKWMDFVSWLFPTMEKMPKKIRFTISQRIENYALDIVEDLIEARYSRNKREILLKVNLKIEKMRILFRICYERKFISSKTFKHFMFSIDTTGKMIGGWIKQQGKGNGR